MTEKPLSTIGVIGAGTMGAGIALVALYTGYDVILQDVSPQVLEKAQEYVRKFLGKKELGDRFKNLRSTNNLDDLAKAQFVIEAAPEQLEMKQDLFRQLDAICKPDAILATNTSTLSVTAIAAATQRPRRVAGMHFFNPAPVLPLVEVVRAAQTSQQTIDTLVELARTMGKTPVVTGDTPGFIVNRVARPFYGEALRLLGEGVASHQVIDDIVERGGGFRMGPFKLMDLIGIDINAWAMLSMYEQTFGEPRYRPHPIQMQKLAAGTLGRKTGRGFYEYKDDAVVPKDEKNEAPKTGGGSGRVLISEGSWASELAELCKAAGYEIDSVPDPEQSPLACFVVAGRAEEATRLIAWFDQSLPSEVPLICQAADITVSEMATWVQHPERLIGFDGLFFGRGLVTTLIASRGLDNTLQSAAEELMVHLGQQAHWISDSPALILPRMICQLANEAAFAQLESVADGATIDLAIKLGVNYPHGPLEFGSLIGYDKVLAVLDHLYNEYHEERYRACVLLRRWAREKN